MTGRMKHSWVVVGTLLAACGGGDEPPADSVSNEDAPPKPATVVFLNRGGGSYTRGTDNSSTNVSSIAPSNLTIAAPTIDEADWSVVRACVDEKFAPYNVTITEVDPTTGAHTEVVVADDLDVFGPGSGVVLLGIAPQTGCTGSFGTLLLRAIDFAAWSGLTNGARCHAIAQVIGSSFGLDHAFSCPDLMFSGNENCGDEGTKTFTNVDVPCGELAGRSCACGLPTQNASSHLLLRVGAR